MKSTTASFIIIISVFSTLATCWAFPLVFSPFLPYSTSSQLSTSSSRNELDDNRRSLLVSGAATSCSVLGVTAVTPTSAFAASDVRAPLELLLPATRVKVYIDQAVSLCLSFRDSDDALASILVPLKEFLEQEPIFTSSQEEKMSKRYLEIKTSSAWQQARLKEREARGAEIGIDYTTPYDKVNTAIQQWGDRRQFKILRSRQRRLEQSNTIRTAFNAYTNNLVFGDAYKLNAQGEEKKAMVRNDALPNVNAVVVSDLDLRDLYRNQVLQNMDDARAEIDYQLKSGDTNVDEILTYLSQAQASCEEWFNLIPKNDVEEALKTVSKEP
jgi:hypothetical protein